MGTGTLQLQTMAVHQQSRPRWHSLSATTVNVASADYATTVARVDRLSTDEAEEVRPSPHASQIALRVLAGAGAELGLDFPRASASVGPNGSIRITWSFGRKEVRLICAGADTLRSDRKSG